MSALWPVQKALVGRLKATPALIARVSGVYDGQAPQGTSMPYVVVGEATERDASAMAERGFSDTITLHVWSAYPGRKEALEIVGMIDLALRDPLSLEGHTEADLRLDFATTLVEEDGVRHMPIRYRFSTFEVA